MFNITYFKVTKYHFSFQAMIQMILSNKNLYFQIQGSTILQKICGEIWEKQIKHLSQHKIKIPAVAAVTEITEDLIVLTVALAVARKKD